MLDRTQEMMDAISEGSADKVQQLLTENPESFKGKVMSGDKSILAHAIDSGNIEIMTKLSDAQSALTRDELLRYNDDIIDANIRLAAKLPPTDVPSLPPELEPPARIPLPVTIAGVNLDDPGLTNIIKSFMGVLNKGVYNEKLKRQERITLWENVPGAAHFQALNVSGRLSPMIHDSIRNFETEFNALIGDSVNKNSKEYQDIIANIAALDAKFLNPNGYASSKAFAEDIQNELAKLQVNLGMLYAKNPTLQSHIPQEDYVSAFKQKLNTLCEVFNFDVQIMTGLNTEQGQVEYGQVAPKPYLMPLEYQKALIDLEASLNEVIGDNGRDSPEYSAILKQIEALQEITDIPGTIAFTEAAQVHFDSIQSLMGQLYANNKDVQTHISIKDFVNGVSKVQTDIVSSLAGGKKQVVLDKGLIFEPIDHAAETHKMDRKGVKLTRPEDLKYKKAINDFKNELNEIIGDRGRDSAEYRALYEEISNFSKLFSTQIPGSAAFYKAAQTHLNAIEFKMGQLYANNPDIQQHVSIREFSQALTKISVNMVSSMDFDGRGNLKINGNLVLQPIVHAVATGKMVRHDSPLKNAEDFRYLQAELSAAGELSEDIGKAMGVFNVLDKFQLAKIINEDPDRVVRYIKSLEEKGGTPATEKSIAIVGQILDMFASDETKQKLAEIAGKLAGKLEDKDVPWYAITTHLANAIEWVKSGVEQLTGYDDITNAINELGGIYDIYGSLFKVEEAGRTNAEVKSFVGRILKQGEALEKGIASDLRNSVEKLIADNGRGSAEFKVVLSEIRKLEKQVSEIGPRTSPDELKTLQANMNNISFAVAKLYANSPAVQQHVSLRDFSEGVAGSMMALADKVNTQCRLQGDAKIYPKFQGTLVQVLAAQPVEQLQQSGSFASRIDAHNYLTSLQEYWQSEPGAKENSVAMQALDKLTNALNSKDNFKLAELINKNPGRVMRVINEMLERNALLPNTTDNDENKEKVATVLNYLSSDNTRENMDKILSGGDFEEGIWAAIAIAIEKGINWLTGFDKEVESAFVELNNLTALHHDTIAKYEAAAVKPEELENKKVEARSFVDRVSKPAGAGMERS